MTTYTSRKALMTNAYKKLGTIMLSFGMPELEDMDDIDIEKFVGGALDDALRENNLKDTNTIEEMSLAELRFENRIVRHMLHMFRISAAAFFKFSTAVDGKTVDKTKISPALADIIDDYDDEWADFIMSSRNSNNGGLWKRKAGHTYADFTRYPSDGK